MRFLIIGGGSIGKRHISNLQALGYSEIICLKRTKDTNFEGDLKVKVITSINELGSLKIDAVFVCTPTSMHLEGIEIATKLEAAIFMEKPLIHALSDLKQIKLILQNYDKIFFIGFMLRYHPLVKKIREIIDSNILGNVYYAHLSFGSYLPNWHPWEDYKISYASRKELGGGVINTITHELDLVQYFFGNPESVTCIAKNLNKLKIEVEEIAEASFEYNDKVVTLHLDYLQKEYDRNIKIFCDDGKITWDWHDKKLTIKKIKENTLEFKMEESFDVNQLYIDEIKGFIKLVQDSKLHHPLDFEHAKTNTELMLLMHESSMKEKKIKV